MESAFEGQPAHVQLVDIRPLHKIDTIPHSQLVDIIVEAMTCHTIEEGRQLVNGDLQAAGQVADTVSLLEERLAAFHIE